MEQDDRTIRLAYQRATATSTRRARLERQGQRDRSELAAQPQPLLHPGKGPPQRASTHLVKSGKR